MIEDVVKDDALEYADKMWVQVGALLTAYDKSVFEISEFMGYTQQLYGIENEIERLANHRRQIVGELQDSFAEQGSIRKKDFTALFSRCGAMNEKSLDAVRDELLSFFMEEKEIVVRYRDNLTEFRESLRQKNIERIQLYKESLEKIIAEHKERCIQVQVLLNSYREEQAEVVESLRKFLVEAKEMRMKDLRKLTVSIEDMHDKRMQDIERRRQFIDKLKSDNLDRKKKVEMMIESFKEQRQR